MTSLAVVAPGKPGLSLGRASVTSPSAGPKRAAGPWGRDRPQRTRKGGNVPGIRTWVQVTPPPARHGVRPRKAQLISVSRAATTAVVAG